MTPPASIQRDPRVAAGEPNHRRLARAWTERQGIVEATVLECTSASAAIVDCDKSVADSGEWWSEDVHYIDMCLTPRPRPSRGCFIDQSNEYRDTGRIFLAPAGRRLRFESSPGRQRALGLFLPAALLTPASEGAADGIDEVLSQCLHIWSETIRSPLLRIAEELRSPGFASTLIVEGLSLVILGELSRLLHQRRPNLGASGGLASWRLNLIEEMVRADRKPPSLAELARVCRLSTRHLTRAFRKETGITLGAFIEQAVMDRARRLLQDTHAPIATIAADTGFASPAGFSAAFRRATGETPRGFRAYSATG
jgi:AraC family transcriptional regulator